MRILWLAIPALAAAIIASGQEWLLPIRIDDRCSWQGVQMTAIGRYGLRRATRPGVPSHLHAGVDLRRPGVNYQDEPIFPVGPGVLVSLRTDGPYAQAIVEHRLDSGCYIWTVYEHIAKIRAALGDSVRPQQPLARFMNRAELNRYGWQFDHLHFEVMKARPRPSAADAKNPGRRYQTYGLMCYTAEDLDRCYCDPQDYLEERWQAAEATPNEKRQ